MEKGLKAFTDSAPKKPRQKPEDAHGDYLKEWLELKDEFPHLFTIKDDIVGPSRVHTLFTAEFQDSGGDSVVFTNGGGKPKENPNPLNILQESRLVFDTCLVERCGKPTKKQSGLCPGTQHWHMDEGEKAALKLLDHFVDWIGILNVEGTTPPIPAADHAGVSELLIKWMGKDDRKRGVADKFIKEVLGAIVGNVKDSTTLQLECERGTNEHVALIGSIAAVVDENFDGEDGGASWDRADGLLQDIPIKVVAQLLAIGFAAEEANRGDYWFRKHVLGQPDDAGKRASAYMSATYYLIRRHTVATETQARMSTRMNPG
jgi:hypothetical protein